MEKAFHYCGSPVKLVQACLWAGNTLERRFNRRSGAVKHVQACLSTSKDGERFSLKEACTSFTGSLQFSPLWKSYEARARVFECKERFRKKF